MHSNRWFLTAPFPSSGYIRKETICSDLRCCSNVGSHPCCSIWAFHDAETRTLLSAVNTFNFIKIVLKLNAEVYLVSVRETGLHVIAALRFRHPVSFKMHY